MKKLYVVLFSLICFQAFAQNTSLIYDDNAQLRQVGNFKAIKVSSAIDLYLTQSNETKVAVSAADIAVRNKIETTVEGETLVIKLAYSNGWGSWGNHKMKAYVSVKELNALMGSGASNIHLLSTISVPKLQVKLSGASDFKGNLEVGVLNVNLSGASDFKAEIKAGSFVLNASGASDCDIAGQADDMSVELSGASEAKLYNLKAKGAIVSTSGASTANVYVTELLKAQASGGSDINYKGTPVLKQNSSSGGSDIRHKD